MAKRPQKRKAGGSQPHAQRGPVSVDVGTLLGQLGLPDPVPLMTAIQEKRGGQALLCLTYNENPPPAHLHLSVRIPLFKVLSDMGNVPKLDLFIRSTGGQAEAPWHIVSLLREFTDELGVIVANLALSGATHIAIAGDELVMTPFAILGSVDPTRKHPLLPQDAEKKPIPTSVQDLKHCIEFIKEQLGESYSSQNLALIISELFKYINPLAIGAVEQSYKLSRLITSKVLRSRKDSLGDEKIENIVDVLSGQYYSHSFPISRDEVESDLGLPVTRPDGELLELILKLDDLYADTFSKQVQANAATGKQRFRVGNVVDSPKHRWACIQTIKEDGELSAEYWHHTCKG